MREGWGRLAAVLLAVLATGALGIVLGQRWATSPGEPAGAAMAALIPTEGLREPPAERTGRFAATVGRVVDGDTIAVDLAGAGERVRLIGIDAPETKHPTIGQEPWGREADRFLRALLPTGSRVWLEYDVERRDRYGRLLAYVFTGDGLFINALLVRAGYASVLTLPPNVRHADWFVQLQRRARQENLGLWQPLLQ